MTTVVSRLKDCNRKMAVSPFLFWAQNYLLIFLFRNWRIGWNLSNVAQQCPTNKWINLENIYIIHCSICNSARRCCSSSITLWAVSLHSTWEHSGLSDPSDCRFTPETHISLNKKRLQQKKPKGNTAFFSRSSSWPSDDASRWWLPKIPKGHLAVNCTFARRRSAATRSPQVGHTTGYLPLGQLSQDDSHHGNINIEMRKRIHIYNVSNWEITHVYKNKISQH